MSDAAKMVVGDRVKYVAKRLECEKCGSVISFTSDGENGWYVSCACVAYHFGGFNEWVPGAELTQCHRAAVAGGERPWVEVHGCGVEGCHCCVCVDCMERRKHG